MSSDQQAKTPNRPDRVRFVRKYALTFVIFVFVEVSGVILEEHKEWVPWLVNVELKAHGWLSSLEARTLRVQRVVTVEIDDEAYFIHFGDPGITPRDKLATLAKAAADVDAAVIALDINLAEDPNEQSREAANCTLLETIRGITSRHIPVVLTAGLSQQRKPPRHWWWPFGKTVSTWESNIYTESDIHADNALPPGTRVGFDNGALDARQIPLVLTAPEQNGNVKTRHSFALEIVDAYEDAIHMARNRKTLESRDITKAINKGEFIFGSFLKPDEAGRCSNFASGEFQCIPAWDVLKESAGQPSAPVANKLAGSTAKEDEPAVSNLAPSAVLEQMRHRIVIIGGNRHERYGGGDWLDDEDSPVGHMRGLYFHANYVEALLDDRIKLPVPTWFNLSFNLVISALLVYCYEHAKHSWTVLALFLIPLIAAYFLSVNVKYSLDFVLPLAVLFFHLFLEHYRHLRHLAKIGQDLAHGH